MDQFDGEIYKYLLGQRSDSRQAGVYSGLKFYSFSRFDDYSSIYYRGYITKTCDIYQQFSLDSEAEKIGWVTNNGEVYGKITKYGWFKDTYTYQLMGKVENGEVFILDSIDKTYYPKGYISCRFFDNCHYIAGAAALLCLF